MKMMMIAPLALLLLAACDGNPFVSEDGGGGGGGGVTGGGGAEPPPTPAPGLTVPASLAKNLKAVAYDKATDSFTITMEALDTTPVTAVWRRRDTLNLAGYTAYTVQEDPLDRMFVGLMRTSTDGSVTGIVAADGGQFNTVFQGGNYSRTGAYTAPVGTDVAGSGQVSYAGNYVGMANTAAPRPNEALPVATGTPQELVPGQPARVQGEVFINANFSDNSVNGAIYNRILVDTGFSLQSVIMVPTDIKADGTYAGETQRWVSDDPQRPVTGEYGGVFGGTGATATAGIVALTRQHWGGGPIPAGTAPGDQIQGYLEHGIFVLDRCGTAGAPAVCSQTLPDFNNGP